MPDDAPRNERGEPIRRAGDDCCPYYRFCEKTKYDFHRCGWREDFRGKDTQGLCVSEKKGRKVK